MTSRSRIRSSAPTDSTRQESVSNLSLSKLLDDDDDEDVSPVAPPASTRQRSTTGNRSNQSSFRPPSRKSLAEMEEEEEQEEDEDENEEEEEEGDEDEEDLDENADRSTMGSSRRTVGSSRRSQFGDESTTGSRRSQFGDESTAGSRRRSQFGDETTSGGRRNQLDDETTATGISRRDQTNDESTIGSRRSQIDDTLSTRSRRSQPDKEATTESRRGLSSRRRSQPSEDILGGPMSSASTRSRKTTNFGEEREKFATDRKSFSNTESKAAKDTESLLTGHRSMGTVPTRTVSGRSRLSKMDQQEDMGDSMALLEASKKAVYTDKYGELINTLDKYGITVESRYAMNDNVVYLKALLFGNYIFIEMDTAYTDLKSIAKDFSIVKDSHVIHSQPAEAISAEQCSKLNGCGVVYECREGLCISNRDMSTFDTVEDRFRITTTGQRSEAFEKDGAPAYPIIKLSQLIVNPQLAINNLEYQRMVLHADAITKYQVNIKIFDKTIDNFTETAKNTVKVSKMALFNMEKLLAQLNNARNGASFPPEPQNKDAYQSLIYKVKGANDLFENLIIGSKYLDEVVTEVNGLYERLQEYNTDVEQHYIGNK